jgi:hypothetical protein
MTIRPFVSLAVVLATVAAHAAPTLSIPSKDLALQGIKQMRQSKRIMLPTVYVEVMNWGKITSVTQTSALQTLGGAANSTARSTLEIAVPSDVAMLRGVAGELYADLAAKLRAGGWEVITHDQVADELKGVNQEAFDAKLGAPVRKVTVGKQKMHYTIAAPEGMPVIDPGMTMPLFGLRSVLKANDFSAMETTYRFDPVALQATGRHGIASNTAGTNAEAKLALAYAQCSLLTAKVYPGWIRLQKPVAVEGNIGEVKKAADVSPGLANGLSAALGMATGLGSISSKKGLYVCDVDQPALKEALLVAGKAFNDEIVKAMGSPQ